jgi:hypothetical protein
VRARSFASIVVTALLLFVPAWAEDEAKDQQSDGGGIHLKGWGVRAGLAADPDQAIVGFHWDLGEIIEHLRLQPNVELGIGDDVLTLFGEIPVHYMFRVQSKFTPYAGGGVVIGLAKYDRNNNKDTSVEGGVRIIGGLQWPLKSGKPFAVEANIGFGDIHDVQVKVAWTF